MTRLDMIVQDYVDIDYCDKCGKAILTGTPIWLDVDKEYSGLVPAYCGVCAHEIKEAGA